MTYLGTYGDDFTTPGTSAEINLQLVVNYTQDIAGNYSDLSWVFQMVEYVNASPFNNNAGSVGNATIETSIFSASNLTYNFNLTNETIVIASGTRRVYHNADGTKTGVPISGSYSGQGGTPLGVASFSTTFDLPTIPRASTPTYSDSTPDAGDAITITTNRADASFTHDIERRWQGETGAYTSIATGVGASTGWTVPSTLVNDIPNATSRVLEIRTTTKQGGTTIGTTLTYITVGVPAALVPDFGTVTHSEATTSPDVATLIGAYVQGWSKLALAITSAVAGTGATVSSKVVQVLSGATVLQTVDVTAGSANTPLPISASGTVTLRGTVTDSRGRTYSEDVAITVLAYTLPTVTTIGLQRALSDGTPDEEGTYIRVDLNAAVQSLIVAATERNALVYRISTSPADAGTWTVKATTTPGGVTFNSHAEVGTYAITDSFDVKVEIYDDLTSASPLVLLGTVSTGGVFLHLGNSGEGVGFGKYWEEQDPAKPASIDALNWIYQANGQRVIDLSDLAAEGLAGIVPLASVAEAEAGTADDSAVTPEGLAAALGEPLSLIDALEARESLVRVVPSSMVVSSGSGSYDSNGLVTFSGVGSLSLRDFCTAEFTNYLVMLNVNSASGGSGLYVRFGATTTDDVTGYGGSYSEHAGSAGWANSVLTNELRPFRISTTGGGGWFRVFTPFSASTKTRIVGEGHDSDNYHGIGGGQFSTAKQHKQLTVFVVGITMTGTMEVYGVRG